MDTRRSSSLRLPAPGLGTALAAAAVVAVLASVLAPGAPVRQALGRAETGGADVIVLLLAVGGELVPAPVGGTTTGPALESAAPMSRGRPEPALAAAPSDRIDVTHLDLPPPQA